MIVEFFIKGKKFAGEVIAKGFFEVDAPECYEVVINSYKFTKYISVSECKVLEETSAKH